MSPGNVRAPACDDTIVDERVRVVRAEAGDGIALSFAALSDRSMVLVEIETADGRVGYGESWVNFPRWAVDERVATLRHGVFPLLHGEDARQITRLHRDLVGALQPIGRQWGAPGPIMQAISAVDIALWDLLGKAEGRAISALAGGRVRESVRVYASSLGPDDVERDAAACVADGHRAVKVRVGFGRDRDSANLAAARQACGKEMTLYADANQAWTLADALQMGPLLRDVGVAWVEEPIRDNSVDDLEEFHRRTGLDVATGENVYGSENLLPYAISPAVRILQPDVTKTGGLTEAMAICQVAQACGKHVIPHLYGGAVAFAATLQLTGCASAVTAIEYDVRANPLRDPLLVDPPRPVDGSIGIPDGPGLALDLNLDAVAARDEQLEVLG